MRCWVLLLIPLVAAVIPLGAAAPTTLYLHGIGFQDMPITTNEPEARYIDALEGGFGTHSMCFEDPAGMQHFTDNAYHTWYGFSAPSYVDYNVDDNGRPRSHQERGLSYDAIINKSVQPVMHWTLVGDGRLPSPDDAVHPPIPDVFVQVTAREGDDVSVGNSGFNEGQIIMQGRTGLATLAGPATEGDVTFHDINGSWVYDFAIPLTIEKDVIDHQEGFNIRVDVMMEEPVCEEGYFMLDHVDRYAAPGFWPRLELDIANALRFELFEVTYIDGEMAVIAYVNSPWGSYDVAGDRPEESPMQATIRGPIEDALVQTSLVSHARGFGIHEHQKPLAVTWTWPRVDPPTGDYIIEVTASNDQGTASITKTATVTVGDGVTTCQEMDNGRKCLTLGEREEKTPTPLWPMLGLLVLARRR